jgi:hypothetical protein
MSKTYFYLFAFGWLAYALLSYQVEFSVSSATNLAPQNNEQYRDNVAGEKLIYFSNEVPPLLGRVTIDRSTRPHTTVKYEILKRPYFTKDLGREDGKASWNHTIEVH